MCIFQKVKYKILSRGIRNVSVDVYICVYIFTYLDYTLFKIKVNSGDPIHL